MKRCKASEHSFYLKVLFFIFISLMASWAYAQREREVEPPKEDYSGKFFDELRSIFGRFRDADLRRVFQMAHAIQCSDLVTDKGEWREVAFFNENRRLGDWYRTSIEEVKGDLSTYTFKSPCGGQHASAEVTTKFPVDESIKLFQDGKIPFRRIDVNVNAPVSATFDSQTQAYTFDLPYLYRVRERNGDAIYTLIPPTVSDRYATDVTNRWECKSVTADDVTYQFLICHTTLLPRNAARARSDSTLSFGASAYTILSDGKEASSSVKLMFDGAPDTVPPAGARAPESGRSPERSRERSDEPAPAAARSWRPATAQAKLRDIGEGEFRLRFNADTWKARIGQSQLIADGAVTNFVAAPRNKDYCAWSPRASGPANQLLDSSKSDSIIYSLEFKKEAQSGTSAIFGMEDDSGKSLGTLQCVFSKSVTPADITIGMWQSVVGSNVALETPGR
jgi:hypothetical protein